MKLATQKGITQIAIVYGIIGIMGLVLAVFVATREVRIPDKVTQPPLPTSDSTMCTADAKLCPDGSYVSRSGPNCEFAPCPSQVDTTGWRTYRNTRSGIEFQYPPFLQINDTGDSVYLEHSIPYKNEGSCDMLQEKPSEELTDFRMGLSIKKNVEALPYVDGYFKTASLSGEYAYQGAEGCGMSIYHFPLADGKTLVVERENIQALGTNSNMWDKEAILQISGVIPRARNNELFYQILSTFKFIYNADTTGWNDYEDKNHSFRVKYPAEDKIFYCGKSIISLGKVSLCDTFGYPQTHLRIRIYGKPEFTSSQLEALSPEKTISEFKKEHINVVSKNTTVDTLPALYLEGNGELRDFGEGPYPKTTDILVILEKNGTYYYFDHFGPSGEQPFDQKTFDKILSTFKFTK